MIFRSLLILNIILTFFLISLGGFVHNTGSSLACPDWPLCYGQIMPVMEGSVLIEHSHRLLASLVGFITILLVFISKKKKPVVFGASILALMMVIFQGLLGGLTVIYKLPTIVSTAHLATSMIFLATLIGIDHKAFYKIRRNQPSVGNLHYLAKISFILIFAQMVLGAFMRHSGLGGVCGVGYDSILVCHDMVDSIISYIPTSLEAQIHVLHRYMGVVVGLFVIIFSFFYQRVSAFLAALLFVVVGLQIAVGVMTVGSNLEMYTTTAHLTGATLLFILAWKTVLVLKSIRIMNQNSGPSYLEDMMDLTKPRLSSLVIFTATSGLLIAPGAISLLHALVGIIATTGIVGGACALNCYFERDVDKYMLRTASRPLPKKRIPPNDALYFGLILIFIFTIILYLSTNLLTTILSIVATIIYVNIYTPMKRKSSWSLVVGAIPGAIPPLMGWTMVTGEIDLMGMVLFGILFLWQLPHFLAIATFRVDEYKKAGLVVTPTVSGMKITKLYIVVSTLLLAAVSLAPGFLLAPGNMYLIFSTILGIGFLALAIYGLFIHNEDTIKAWARRYFWGSIIYLPVLFFGLVFLL